MRAALDKVPTATSSTASASTAWATSGNGATEVGGNCWRTTGDITDTWGSMAGIGFSAGRPREVRRARATWNDPDMLVVGKVGWGPNLHPTRLTPNEQYTHISLWCLLCSPLLIGCDMTQLDDFTLSLLTNDEVLEVNQDPLGKQAARVAQGRRRSKSGPRTWKTAPRPSACSTAAESAAPVTVDVVRPGHHRQADGPRSLAAEGPRQGQRPIRGQGPPPRRGADPALAGPVIAATQLRD